MLNSVNLFIKRTCDKIAASLAVVIFSPILLILALLVRLKLGKPILFCQKRPGLNGKLFNILKFRTMTNDRDEKGKLLPDAERLPPFGQWLRSTSLDELPELINIMKGDMSFVGPRPLLVSYLDRYTPEQARRHQVKPGITGWAQVNGRNAISWEEKFKLDVWYVDHWSLWLDLKILLLTIIKVIKREGISAANHVTMSEFQGNKSSNR
ncbi:sugar transferase [Spirulina major CS-329]|uniref:sugar transferase n=1 Tax=Spirulina TaxID=1154 RepID=UPI00232B50AA|nr:MULTISPECIES: sugar transferase [Spirulina]MDB9494346.1 sugar transferase [Spirulina subsalsa CS-330]MDB9502336.1 sugar transferase [Spirulina major CS-329]